MTRPDDSQFPSEALYGELLSGLHHEHFGQLSIRGAELLAERLARAGFRSGTIVELACGAGTSSQRLVELGYAVEGIDQSMAMIERARRTAPTARFRRASLWDVELPNALAVTALGEALGYHGSGPPPTAERLEELFGAIARCLQPGGLLLFDVATPGRAGASRARNGRWSVGGFTIALEETEDRVTGTLDRHLEILADSATVAREHHRLTLYDPEQVARSLERVGLPPERLDGYGDFAFSGGWVGFLAVRATS